MHVQKIKNRSVLFTFKDSKEWDLNLHLIMGKDFNFLIDTGLGSLSVAPISEYLLGSDKPVIVINTHYHWDHIWGNSSFMDSVIISHVLCREIIDKEWENMLARNEGFIRGKVEKCLPNLVFEKELYFPKEKVRLIYTPGHTVDSISVLDEEDGVLNAGDNIGDNMEEIVPCLDCDNKTYLSTLHCYQSLEFDTCVSGHNAVLDKAVITMIMEKL